MDMHPARLMPSREVLLVIGGFSALSFAVYGLYLPETFITLNDAGLVYHNPLIQHISLANIKAVFTQYDPELYIPLTYLSYQIDWWLGGGSAFIFHLDNLILHTINSLFICWLVTMFSRNRWVGIVCGLVFLVHPINTETVLWVSARKDLLSTFFGRLTLVSYMYYILRYRRQFLYLSMAMFLFALLAKVKVILLPCILLLIDWKEGRPLSVQMFTEKIPHFLLSVLFSIVAIFGKEAVLTSSDLTVKIFLGVKSAAFYIQHFLIPYHFSVYYPYLRPVSLLSADFLWSLMLLLLFCGIAVASLRWTREVCFGCGIYFIGIIPSLTNLAKGADLFIGSDRYAYTALVGITYAITSLVLVWWQRVNMLQVRWVIAICAPVLVCILVFLSYRQSSVWDDSLSLYRHAVAMEPSYYRLYYDLGVALDEGGKVNEAMVAYEQSLALSTYPLAHLNLGRDYYLKGQRRRAREQFLLALENRPHFAMALFNLGVMAGEDGIYDDAKRYYKAAIAEHPSFLDARLNLAAKEAEHGDIDEALQDLTNAFALDPQNKRTRALLAYFLQRGITKAQSIL